MFAATSSSILAGTLMATAWLSTTAAERAPVPAARTTEMTYLEPLAVLDRGERGLVDSDVRIAPIAAKPDQALEPEATVKLFWPAGQGPYPVVVYFRDAGSRGDADPAGAARALAKSTDAVVVSVSVDTTDAAGGSRRVGNGHAADQAYRWALANAGSLGGDPRRVAVMGEGPAAAVAMTVAEHAQQAHLQPPYCLVLVNGPATVIPAISAPAPGPRFQDISWPAAAGRAAPIPIGSSARTTHKTYTAM